LLGIHAVAFMYEKTEISLKISEQLKREGKIRHIGFSTHGTSSQIMNLINSERVSYATL
jgi:predicted aldo/keto reductase-like oxidoreductase